MVKSKQYRPDKEGPHKTAFLKNKKRLLATQSICAICGQPIDKTLKFPDPMSPVIDHIIPIAKGGHPSDINNLQLTHLCCNRAKGDSLAVKTRKKSTVFGDDPATLSNRVLPQSLDWSKYRG